MRTFGKKQLFLELLARVGTKKKKKQRRTIPPLKIAAHANWTAMGTCFEGGKMSVLNSGMKQMTKEKCDSQRYRMTAP